MMNIWRTVAVAATAALWLACPAPTVPESHPPELRPPDWLSGETGTYHVTRGDSVLYETRVFTRFDAELITLPAGQRSVPTVVVTTVVRPVAAPTYFFDSTIVVFRRDSLLPLRSHRELETDLASFIIDATYSPGRVHIRKQSIDGIVDTAFAVAGQVMDQDMLWTALRAFLPDPGKEMDLTVVVPLELRQREARLKVLGTRLVAAPVDSIICRVYEYAIGTREIRLWYEIEQPRRLVGFFDPANNIQTLLAGYEPGRPDTLPLPVSSFR